MNGYLHLGHAFTYLRADMVSRYKRMKDKNVLFPFAFHCTGTPIVAAAQRVKEGEETQIKALEQMGLIDDYHMTIFRALHQTQRDLATPELLFRFIEEAGIDRETFESTYRSSQVIAAMDQADQMARRLKVAAVPTIIVQGKYSVRTTRSIGQKRMLDVMDHLAAIERSIKTEG